MPIPVPPGGRLWLSGHGAFVQPSAGLSRSAIPIAASALDMLLDPTAALEPTFGGINLEDIQAPACFYVERQLRARMKIPVFHDDQHGTAIIVGAAFLNGLK